MRKILSGRYSYVLLWFLFALAVGGAWLFGKSRKEEEPRSLSSSAVSASEGEASEAGAVPEQAGQSEELKGLWVPYLALQTEEQGQKAFEDNFRKIADLAKDKGFNALFVHIRPFCDAFYPSDLFPWSHLLSGEQGKDPGYDPLKFMVEYTKKQGLAFHAWLNPLRIKTAQTPASLSSENPYLTLSEDSPYYFLKWDGGVYWNPAYPYVRSLIAQGVEEIVKNYPVDGIHFDDYFYPSSEEDFSLWESSDEEAYDLYCETVAEPLPISQWRCANISAMVEEVYRAVKKANPKAVFGISPQGNIENDERMGADVKTWCKTEGYVDYLCPQLYYSFENEALGYEEALEEWVEIPRQESVRLFAGLALYKAGSDADQGTWEGETDILKRQIEAARKAGLNGVVFYSSQYLESEATREEVKNAMAVLGES